MTDHRDGLTEANRILAATGASLSAFRATAPYLGVVPAGADEVSTVMATQLFAAHNEIVAQITAHTRAVHQHFATLTRSSAAS